MTHLPPSNNPQTIWRNQKSEVTVMSTLELQSKILKAQSRRRREIRFNLILTVIITAIFVNVFVRYVHGSYGQIGWGLVIGGTLYVLGFILYETLRERRSERFDSSLGMSNSLQFYRRILEQKRQHARHMAVAAIPLVIGAMMNTIPAVLLTYQYPEGNLWVRLLPFFFIMASWLVLFAMIRRRFHREMRRELAMIEALEKEHPE
jgi:hypothetical protein